MKGKLIKLLVVAMSVITVFSATACGKKPGGGGGNGGKDRVQTGKTRFLYL